MTAVPPQLETIEIVLFENGVAEIAHNRPKRFNALNPQAYSDWLTAMKWAATEKKVKVVILTGRGNYYSSGQELALPKLDDEASLERLERQKQTAIDLLDALIDFPKILIAAVNGLSLGFATTTLALCDVVYSVPEATFRTPFMKLGFCAEGCSSILFPRIMGMSKANEMLLLGRTFTAQELVDCAFVSRLIPSDVFRETVLEIASEAAKFSSEAIEVTKTLIRDVDRELLKKVNRNEMDSLVKRMASNDSMESILKFQKEIIAKKAAKKAKL